MAYDPPSSLRCLRLRFDTAPAFAREYRENVSRGGAFVPGASDLELRTAVQVVLELGWCGESVQLSAEVVHVVPPELAAAGGTAGVAVQFQTPAPELRALLGRFAEEGGATKPDPIRAEPRSPGSSEIELEEGFAFGSSEPAAAEGALDLFDEPSAESFDPTLRDIEPPPASKPEGVPRARREITRVQVLLATSDQVLEGRTRDISHSGVLVSVDGNEVPVGAPVRLTLRDPVSGGALDVEGTVARHVLGAGTVAALGIHFEVQEERRAEVEQFVDRLWLTDHARRLGGIRGDVAEVGLASLLQILSQSAPCGTLCVTHGGEEGMVAFENHQLRYVRLGSLGGVKALVRMLAWSDAAFEFHAHVDALEQEEAPEPVEAALLEAMRLIDEGAQHTQVLDPEARLSVDADRAAGQTDALGKTQLAVVDLVGAGLTLRRVLDVIPESDGRILAAIESLRERGILSVEP
jgi:Tfp pilus assembly protein PilZ